MVPHIPLNISVLTWRALPHSRLQQPFWPDLPKLPEIPLSKLGLPDNWGSHSYNTKQTGSFVWRWVIAPLIGIIVAVAVLLSAPLWVYKLKAKCLSRAPFLSSARGSASVSQGEAQSSGSPGEQWTALMKTRTSDEELPTAL